MDKTGLLDGMQPFDRVLAIIYRPSGLVDLDYLAYLDFFDDLLSTTNVAFPQRLRRTNALKGEHASFTILPVARMNAALLADAARLEARLQARLRTVGASLAIERYRDLHSALPDSLDDLVPKFLDAVVADPFTGGPLRYKKLAKGYVVYSVGEDGKDDGGTEPKRGYLPGTDITFTVER